MDRRKPHRNSDVARAVRKTRDRLSQQAGSLDFDRELLKLHARAMVVSAVAIPLLVLAVALRLAFDLFVKPQSIYSLATPGF